MKKVKINLLAIIGMMVAVGTLAFTAPKEKNLATSWYLIEIVNGTETLTTESTSVPSAICPSTQDHDELCAVEVDEQGLSGMTLQDVKNANIPIEDKRFKPEP